jgi:hypothetical protein
VRHPSRTLKRPRSDTRRRKMATPQPGLRPAAVALRAAQNGGLPGSSDRPAPDPSRQSADGCALWSRLETRYLRLPSPLRHNIFPLDASALWSTFGRGSALATRCPSSLPLCFRHRQQFVDRESSSSPVSTPFQYEGLAYMGPRRVKGGLPTPPGPSLHRSSVRSSKQRLTAPAGRRRARDGGGAGKENGS